MYKFKEDNMNVPCYVWSDQGSIEQGAIDQIKNSSSLPFTFHHTSLMADGHTGYGVPIGSVVALKDVISPFMVGVDIGCGICAIKTDLVGIDTSTLKKIMSDIRKAVPVGFSKHQKPVDLELMPDAEGCSIVQQEFNNAALSLGSLGGGNHFIEIQLDADDCIWIMIHSGSRNLGYKVAKHYNEVAVNLNEKWFSVVPKSWELAFLPTDSQEGVDYIQEMNYCVEYALQNRKLMMKLVCDAFQYHTQCNFEQYEGLDLINIAHNYAALENHYGKNVMIHRKGATRARTTDIGTIPGSQGTNSYIVRGRSNPESFNSCSHGAGRTMSRTKARETLDLSNEQKILDDRGVIHSIRNSKDLDEASSAYKDIQVVMSNQTDLVDVLVELKPLAVIKG